jgi:hypothetical protein
LNLSRRHFARARRERNKKFPAAECRRMAGGVLISERASVRRSHVNLPAAIRLDEPLSPARPPQAADPRSGFSFGDCFCDFT